MSRRQFAINVDDLNEQQMRDLLVNADQRERARLKAFGMFAEALMNGGARSINARLEGLSPELHAELGAALATFGTLFTQISDLSDAEEARILTGEATPAKPPLN